MIRHAHAEVPDPNRTHRRRRLAAVATLPTLLTLGNLIFGFVALYQCGLEMRDIGSGVTPAGHKTLNSDFFEARAPSFLSIAVWMLVGAMLCDALDGRLARLTRRASKFGEQLDSLADVVSFGVAPALMMVTLMRREVTQLRYAPFGFDPFMRFSLFIGVIYACCTALRLARFNVETTLDESAHRGFKGLPSPGSAGALISVILLHDHLDQTGGWPRLAGTLMRALPVMALILALLMVSRVPYGHAVSSFLRRRPLGHVVVALLVLPLLWIWSPQTLCLAAWMFVLSGPLKWLYRRARPQLAPAGGPLIGASGDHPTSAESYRP
ncbi:MAG: CDP-alcohol phosphatidyltransferase family protein [Phycisphaerae bacterium]|jgi:CDP-diacylglycerol--serine O-phosphatidyltransferase